MKWSLTAWRSVEPIYNRILDLPFLRELMDGTLPKEKFYFYLNQDAFYLAEYGKLLAGIAARLNNTSHREAFLQFAMDTITIELALHEIFLKDAPKTNGLGPSPSCLLYTGYLSIQVLNYPIEKALAAVLPCFWIYQKVGDYIVEHQKKGSNPFQRWIDTYSGQDFASVVNQAISICDEVGEKSSIRSEMTEAFIYASKMEWLFWDSAYRLEVWPV